MSRHISPLSEHDATGAVTNRQTYKYLRASRSGGFSTAAIMAHTNNAFQEVAGRESAFNLASALPYVAPRLRVASCPSTFLWSYKSRTATAGGTLNSSYVTRFTAHVEDCVCSGKPLKWPFRVGDQPPALGQGIWEAGPRARARVFGRSQSSFSVRDANRH
jgi:hypothetical protein